VIAADGENERVPDSGPGRSRNVAALAVAFEGGLGLAALLLGWVLGVWPIPGVEAGEIVWRGQWPALLWGLAATGPMLVGFWLIDRFPWGPLGDLKHDVERLVVPLFRNCSVRELALIAAAAGIGEEMLFRGLVQHALAQWLAPPWGVWIALVVAAFVFGGFHPLSATYAVLAALIGLYLGLLLIFTGNLLAPALAHGLYDFIALLYLVRDGE
jgi:hypothetical protein